MLSIRPVDRLSTQSTVSPRLISRSHRCDPTNPAPPVTTTRIRQTSAPIGKTIPDYMSDVAQRVDRQASDRDAIWTLPPSCCHVGGVPVRTASKLTDTLPIQVAGCHVRPATGVLPATVDWVRPGFHPCPDCVPSKGQRHMRRRSKI